MKTTRSLPGSKLQHAVLACLIYLLGIAICHAQSTADATRFEVASIRTAQTNDGHPAIQFLPNGGIRATSVTLKILIEAAYEVRPEQIIGGDAWLDQDQFVVNATAPQDTGHLTSEEHKAITLQRIQNLLADRFSLKLREQAKLQSTYVLIVDNAGIKMEESSEPGGPRMLQRGRYEIDSQRVSMQMLCGFLGVHLQGTVIDQTGLKGRYNFILKWPPDSRQVATEYEAGMPQDTLLPAVREQLGLRLKTEKAEVSTYRVIRAAKPEAN